MEVFLIFLVIGCGILNISAANDGTALKTIYTSEIQRLDELLATKCPEYVNTKLRKRDVLEISFGDQKEHYNALINQLDLCAKSKAGSPSSVTAQDTKTECMKARNVTDWWRKSWHLGWACDFNQNGWFRFTGAAGNRVRDSCPKDNTCGTGTPYWTDAAMPAKVGIVSKVKVYGVRDSSCKKYSKDLEVMRCPDGLIYRYTGKKTTMFCNSAFCAMD